MIKPVLTVSVRDLADFCTASGDLTGARVSLERAQEGSAAHRFLQKSYTDAMPQDATYSKEVALTYEIDRGHYILRLQGRADGIIEGAQDPCIQEIKTTYIPLEQLTADHNPSYAAQLYIYSFIYAANNNSPRIKTLLTYYNIQSRAERSFEKLWSFDELHYYFLSLTQDYVKLCDLLMAHRSARDEALNQMSFPFENYRPNQQNFINEVYSCIKDGSTLFAEAPTGTGKTIATLYPALKALGKGLCEKVFYLTAKGQTGLVAMDTLTFLQGRNIPLKVVHIIGKERVCKLGDPACDPGVCEYCKGFFTKLRVALPQMLQLNTFDTKAINDFAATYKLCPFELSLVLSEYCDCIVCDYNYVFNPNIRLKRYFSNGSGKYAFLIDEAHNLVDRIRDTFSITLSKNEFKKLKASCAGCRKLVTRLTKIIKYLDELAEERDAQQYLLPSQPEDMPDLIRNLLDTYNELVEQQQPVPEAFEDEISFLLDYLMVSDHYSKDTHCCYCSKQNNDFTVNILCLMPAPFVRQGLSFARGATLFSATLSPEEYYLKVLGADDKSSFFRIPSPFAGEQLLVAVEDRIDTTYARRAASYKPIAQLIRKVISAKEGKYIAYFPSYEYMNRVYEEFRILDLQTRVLLHTPKMSEKQKDAFMAAFTQGSDGTLLGFSVMGGHFSEGIDLPGDQLLGVVVVGVGLPALSADRNLIQQYFSVRQLNGFDYAYVYPGMTKVLQTAGRVIRTAEDMGVVVLVDRRFARSPYNTLFPEHYRPVFLSRNDCSLDELLEEFWN